MSKKDVLPTLRIGLPRSGFIARPHLQSVIGVRKLAVAGVYSTATARPAG